MAHAGYYAICRLRHNRAIRLTSYNAFQGHFYFGFRNFALIEIFARLCLGHGRPQQGKGDQGNPCQDCKAFPVADDLEHESGRGGADRGGNGYQSADEPAHQIEAAGAGGQVRDDQDGEDSDRGGADAAKQLSGDKDRDIGRDSK
jgi:hypothetical protein